MKKIIAGLVALVLGIIFTEFFWKSIPKETEVKEFLTGFGATAGMIIGALIFLVLKALAKTKD